MKRDGNRTVQSAPGQCRQPGALSFNTGALSLNTGTHEETTVETVKKSQKTTYPWGSMALLMTVTVGQRCFLAFYNITCSYPVSILTTIVTFSYAASGLQAILELYFSTFLYVCSAKHAVPLASTSVNVYIAVYQICALLGGYLADRVLGKIEVILFQ